MPKKQLAQAEIAQIQADLREGNSEKRRSAAKKIGKHQLAELGEALLAAYLEERQDHRTWETQTEMLLAFGNIGCMQALPYIREIVDRNAPTEMTTIAAARSYVRLTRGGLRDARPVLELLRFGGISVRGGALGVLAFDEMTPPESEIEAIISLLDACEEAELSIRGLMDPREYLLSCLSKCDSPTGRAYIQRFLQAGEPGLRYCAEQARAGKRSRYE